MSKSPAAPSNLIHIMKSLWRFKSNGLSRTRNKPKHIPPLRIYGVHRRCLAPLECLRVKRLCANDLSPFLWLPIGIRIRQQRNKGDPTAVARCREFLLCHGEEREIMSALSGLICLIWGQRLRPSLKVGHHGISAWLWAQKIFNLSSATQWAQKRMQGLEMDLRVCKNVARHKQQR